MTKLSVAIADHDAAADAFVVWRGFAESMAKAKAYGYDGVELALRQKSETDTARLDRLLAQNGLEVSAVSTGQVFAALKLYLTSPDKELRTRAVQTLCGLAEVAGEFCALMNIGRARGFYAPGQNREQAESLFLASLEEIAETADKHGVSIILEPVNRYEINFINNVQECSALLERARSKNLGIMPDVFHMNIEDIKIGATLEQYARQIRYIHLADSNRHAPGDGHLDFADIFSSLARMKYDGWLSVEILPYPTPDEAAKRAIEFLRPMMKQYGLAE